MPYRFSAAVLGTTLLACPATYPVAALGAEPVQAPSAAMQYASTPTPELMAQIAGALAGFGVYSLVIAPQAAAIGGVTGFLEGRVGAVALSGAGAVGATYLYDVAAGQPVNFGYFWHRGGFVAGIAAGVVAFGALGYPAGGGTTWTGWAANRVALLGTGLIGAWAADRWYGEAATETQAPANLAGR